MGCPLEAPGNGRKKTGGIGGTCVLAAVAIGPQSLILNPLAQLHDSGARVDKIKILRFWICQFWNWSGCGPPVGFWDVDQWTPRRKWHHPMTATQPLQTVHFFGTISSFSNKKVEEGTALAAHGEIDVSTNSTMWYIWSTLRASRPLLLALLHNWLSATAWVTFFFKLFFTPRKSVVEFFWAPTCKTGALGPPSSGVEPPDQLHGLPKLTKAHGFMAGNPAS